MYLGVRRIQAKRCACAAILQGLGPPRMRWDLQTGMRLARGIPTPRLRYKE